MWLRNVFKAMNITSSCLLLSVCQCCSHWMCFCLISRDCLAFCTEPVFASLANVLGQWDNLPSPVPTDIKEYKLYDVETKYGLLQVRWFLVHMKNIDTTAKIITVYSRVVQLNLKKDIKSN